MDMSEDMIKRSVVRAAEDETSGAPSTQNFHLVGDEEYLPLQPKYVRAFSDTHDFLDFFDSGFMV
jgi:hypothetical protein